MYGMDSAQQFQWSVDSEAPFTDAVESEVPLTDAVESIFKTDFLDFHLMSS